MTKGQFAVSAAIAVLIASAPSFAQDSDKKEEKKVERIVIIRQADEKAGEHKGGETRVFRMHKIGEGSGDDIEVADCAGGDKSVIDETTGKEKTKIVLCGKGGVSAQDRAKELEELRGKLAQNEHLSAEHKAKVEAAIQRAIDRLRAGN